MANQRVEKPLTGHVDLVYPTEYVKAADLRGKDVTVVIDRVMLERLQMQGGRKEDKPVVHLRSLAGKLLGKRLICNKTNAKLIARATGKTMVDAWPGQKITLYPTMCRGVDGGQVECIRVRVQASQRVEEPTEEMMLAPAPRPEFVEEADDQGGES